MFTKQHYKAIAEVLRVKQPRKVQAGWTRKMKDLRAATRFHHRCVVEELADLFVRDNSRFDRQRFVDAAELEE